MLESVKHTKCSYGPKTVFLKSPKRVWSRDLILEKIWEIDFIGDTKTVDVHVRWLREKLEEDPSAPKLLKTVRGFGYKFGRE